MKGGHVVYQKLRTSETNPTIPLSSQSVNYFMSYRILSDFATRKRLAKSRPDI